MFNKQQELRFWRRK